MQALYKVKKLKHQLLKLTDCHVTSYLMSMYKEKKNKSYILMLMIDAKIISTEVFPCALSLYAKQ